MATTTRQLVFIGVLAAVMLIGTIGSFVAMVLANENQQKEDQRTQEIVGEWKKANEEYELKLKKQTDDLSKKYYPLLSRYVNLPAKYNREDIKKLRTTDLRKGNGAEIKADSKFAVYYIGWNPDGKIFDQSIDGKKLKEPFYRGDITTGKVGLEDGLDEASLIEGWKKGMVGMKVGGIRLIEIPSDLAYGEAGGGDDIPPNTPLKFIVMAIDPPAQIEQPIFPEVGRY